MDYCAVIERIKAGYNPANVAGMARYGINVENCYGMSMPELQKLAKEIGKDHKLALQLWTSGIHDARILAGLIDDAKLVTEEQLEDWVKDFVSWDLCDQVCTKLFDRTVYARDKALEWAGREEEFVKRAGFVLMAGLAVHNKKVGDEFFAAFFPLIEAGAGDDRNFVKKAVNWALRQIGKRNAALNKQAIAVAEGILAKGTQPAGWIARDALRELKRRDVHWARDFGD
jgi:3-methyladenine DNA glycosylase AlkD